MGFFRRSSTATEPETKDQTVQNDGPLGPTGRPLHPVGAYFEAAFRRFGINIGGYLLAALACGLLPLAGALINSAISAPEGVELFIFFLGFTLGNVLLVALSTVLVSGSTRDRLTSIGIVCVVTALIGAALAALHPVILIVLYPLIVFPPIVVASGDADGLRALVVGARTTLRWFKRTYACMFGVALVAVATWFGFTILLSPLQSNLQRSVAFAITTLLVWPVAALVFRNLYGDVTGRLVINASPKEDERRRDLLKRRTKQAKQSRERIRRVRDE